MTLSRSNILLAAALIVTAGLATVIDIDDSQPNYEFMPDMKRSPAFAAYVSNPNFANGRTLQAPVAGTIARGELPLYYTASKEDAVRAGDELQNPYSFKVNAAESAKEAAAPDERDNEKPNEPDPKSEAPDGDNEQPKKESEARERLRVSVDRGGEVYGVFCVSCHGPTGAGDGPVAKRGFPPPPPLTTGKSAKMKDGQLFHILTYGQGSMAPMAAQLSRGRRWDVINFVRSMQQKAAPSEQPAVEPKETTDAAGPQERGQ